MKNQKMQQFAEEGDKFADRRDPRLFVKAPKIIIYDKKISSSAKVLYFILQDYGRSGKINVGVERLAADMEVSKRQLRNLLGELEGKNLIRRLPVFNSPNNIVLLSLQPQGVALDGGDHQHQLVQQSQPAEPSRLPNRPAQRRRPPTPADAVAPTSKPAEPTIQPTTGVVTTSTTATASTNRTTHQERPALSGRGEKYFPTGVVEEATRQDDPTGDGEFFFQKGVKNTSPKEEEFNKINSTVCEARSSDVSQKPLNKVKERSDDYHLTEQGNLESEQEIGEDREKQHGNMGYVALCNFGIWEGKARRLVELAAQQHGDEANRYISDWIEETKHRKRVQDPCAYLSSAISDNWKLPAARNARQSERRVTHQSNAASSRSNRSTEAHRQRQLKPIDFNKYANVTTAAIAITDQEAAHNATGGSLVAPPVYRETDFYLRHALKDYCPQTAYLLDYAELKGDMVAIRFMGGRQPIEFEPEGWLRVVKTYYPKVKQVELIKS